MAAEPVEKKSKIDETQKAEPVLYSYFRSSCSWRVRIALNLKGVLYQIKPVHLLQGGGQQFAPEYLQLNSMAEVPTLAIDGHNLCQSRAIIEYLEETRPAPSLMPEDPFLRCKVRQLSDIITSDIQPVQNLRVLSKHGGDDASKKQEWARHWIENGFKGLEAELSQTAGKYCVGDEITVADLCLVPQMYNARRFGVDLSAFPTIVRIDAELASHPAFVAAHPTAQIDCPESEKPKSS